MVGGSSGITSAKIGSKKLIIKMSTAVIDINTTLNNNNDTSNNAINTSTIDEGYVMILTVSAHGLSSELLDSHCAYNVAGYGA